MPARGTRCNHGGVTPLRAALLILAASGASTAIIYVAFGREARRTMPRRLMMAMVVWSLACFGGLAFVMQPSLIR